MALEIMILNIFVHQVGYLVNKYICGQGLSSIILYFLFNITLINLWLSKKK